MTGVQARKLFFILIMLWVSATPAFASGLIEYKLPDNQWRLISLPAGPQEALTVKAVFSDDIPGVYRKHWILYSYHSAEKSYQELGYEAPLSQGKGYWIIQKTGHIVSLDMPENSVATKEALPFDLVPPEGEHGSPQWNLSGNPYSVETRLSDISVKTESGICSHQTCNLEKANSENILYKNLWRYDGTRYEAISVEHTMAPWEGFWTAVLAGARDVGKVSLFFPGSKGIWQPAPGASWQWQLSGRIDTSFNVDMYDVDLFETPQRVIDQLHAKDRVVICYFSAGSYESNREDAALFTPSLLGKVLDDYPDEKWLDIRQMESLKFIMSGRMDLAKSKKCDGIEPDNIDAYTNNSGFPLTAQDQLNYNTMLANEAHKRGLSVGLKNDIDQVDVLQRHFDWALNEQCFQYGECNVYDGFIAANKAVFGVEYIDEDGSGQPDSFCPLANQKHFSWLQKRLALDTWRVDCQTAF